MAVDRSVEFAVGLGRLRFGHCMDQICVFGGAMRKISSFEAEIIERVIASLPESAADQLRLDFARASARDVRDDGEQVFFVLDGYDRPEYKGQAAYPVEMCLLDADGADLTVILYMDGNGHLYELEIIRWDDGRLVDPDLSTLRIYA